MKTSVCIEMIYHEVPFLERIKLAADQGFDAVEFWNWDNKNMPAIKAAAEKANIEIATFQLNRGGTLINPAHRSTFISGIIESLEMAVEMKVKKLFLLTDELGEDRSVKYQFPELSEEEKSSSVLEGLKSLAQLAEASQVTLVLEPLNNLVDHTGYWLKNSAVAAELIRTVNSPNIRMLFDIYHQQITEGNIIENLTKNIDVIGHVHVADVPGRHEPGSGELNFINIFKRLDLSGYKGYVGFEFNPTMPSKQAASSALELVREYRS